MHRFREIVAVAGVIIFLFLLRTPSAPAFTPEEERQLLRDVTEIKATLRVFMEQTNKRFEDMNRRFEDINKRFEEVNHRFDQLYTFLWIITGIFTSIMVAVIAFALWDRRTIVNRARDEAVERLLGILRDYAREEPRLREILRRYGFA